MAEATNKVVFATEEVTLHLLMSETQNEDGTYNTQSQVFLPGQFVDQEKVPPYLLDAIKEGKSPGLELMTESKASELSEKAAQIRALASDTVNVQGPVSEGDKMAESIKAAKSQ